MKKNLSKGFFLSETIVVLAIVAGVLIGVFQVYTSVYTKYKTSEKYNTPASINALTSIQNYYNSITSVNLTTLITNETDSYIDLTSYSSFNSEYYTKLKNVYEVDKIYLIDLSRVFTENDIDTFDVVTRKYLKTLQNKGGVILLVNVNGNEFTYVQIINYNNISLVGDEDDEYLAVVSINGVYTEPGYSGTSITPVITCEPDSTGCSVSNNTVTLDTTSKKTYYLYYSFNGYILRRRVEVKN